MGINETAPGKDVGNEASPIGYPTSEQLDKFFDMVDGSPEKGWLPNIIKILTAENASLKSVLDAAREVVRLREAWSDALQGALVGLANTLTRHDASKEVGS